MSNILAIDTSTDACSVAMLTPGGVQQTIIVAPREHTQRLLPLINTLLADHQMSLSQCDAIAFGVGPGSFTGLRIALSTAQGLAYGADLPLIPVSTLKTMVHTAVRLGLVSGTESVVPVIDARMNEVYWSAYQKNNDQPLVEIHEETIASPESLLNSEFITAQGAFVGVGSGWHYACLSSTNAKKIQLDVYPEAYDVAVLAQEQYANKQTISPLTAIPTYMRNEVSWKKRQWIREK